MNVFGDSFDTEDAIMIGGAMGFAEESMREEDEALFGEPKAKSAIIRPEELNETSLQIFRNTNPELFAYVVEMVMEQKRDWRKKILAMQNNDDHELKALEETEKLLDDSGSV